jgi:hypothetical protein
MAPDLFFYQLALIALVWLYLMLHWAWSSDPAACSTTAEFSSPLPKPKPFAGLSESRPALRHPCSSSSGGAAVRSTPRTISVPPLIVAMAAGPVWATWVSGSSHAKTYGKAHCQGETFPKRPFIGKVRARSHQHVKELYHVTPGEPRIVFGKVPDHTRCKYLKERR